MVSVPQDPLLGVAPPRFVIIERSNHSHYFLCRSFVWLGYSTLCSHDSRWCADTKQVFLRTHHLDRIAGKAVLPATRANIDTTYQLLLIIFFVPETYHPVLLRRKAIRLRKETGNQEWHAPIEKLDRSIAKTVLWSCIRPFQLLFFEPMVSSPMSRGTSLVGLPPCSSASIYASYPQSYWESCTSVSTVDLLARLANALQSLVHFRWCFVPITVSVFRRLVLHSWACSWACSQVSVPTQSGGESTAGSCGSVRRKGVSLGVQNQSFGFRQQYLALGLSQLHSSVSLCISLTFQRASNLTLHAGFGWTTYSS